MTLLAVPFGVSMGRRGTLYGIGVGIVMALVLLDPQQRVRRARQRRAARPGPRRVGPQHHRRSAPPATVPDGENLTGDFPAVRLRAARLPATVRLLQRGEQVAGEEPVPESLAQEPAGNLPGHHRPIVRPSRRGACADESPHAAPDVRCARSLELAVGLLNSVRVDLQLLRQLADRRQRIVRSEKSRRDAPLNLVDDLPNTGRGSPAPMTICILVH